MAIGFWRNPGDDLEIETSGRHHRPTQANALTCVFDAASRSAIFQGLIRDEEAAGSNPATPTRNHQVRAGAFGRAPALISPFGGLSGEFLEKILDCSVPGPGASRAV